MIYALETSISLIGDAPPPPPAVRFPLCLRPPLGQGESPGIANNCCFLANDPFDIRLAFYKHKENTFSPVEKGLLTDRLRC